MEILEYVVGEEVKDYIDKETFRFDLLGGQTKWLNQ